MQDDAALSTTETPAGASFGLKIVILLIVLLAMGVVLVTNRWLSDRFTETTRNKA